MPGQKAQLTCPKCGGAVHRAHRRPWERIVSLVIPLRRYSCHHCGWSGVHPYVRARWRQWPRQQRVARIVLIVIGLLVIVCVAIALAALGSGA